MKYKVLYESRANENVVRLQFEFESQSIPTTTDGNVIDLALKDSVAIHKSGIGAITIISVDPLP